jgi:hypothetical protein
VELMAAGVAAAAMVVEEAATAVAEAINPCVPCERRRPF